jgi:isoquinoline 1-oxidoreductase subunit beta
MSGIYRVTRRDFLRHMGVGTGALVFGASFTAEELFGATPKLRNVIQYGLPLGAFVAIKPISGDITIWAHRSEMGQGIKSSLAAVLADELEADWSKVTVRQADADAVAFGVPFPFPEVPGAPAIVRGEDAQFTDSSRSMAAYFLPMRLFGAGIRLVFTRATADKWNVPMSELEVREQRVYHNASNRSIGYHHLLLEARHIKIPTTDEVKAALKRPDQWRFIGKNTMPFDDAKDMVMGKATYGADVDTGHRGMLTAMIVRCPVANGKVKSFDATEAMKVPGVKFVEAVYPPNYPLTGGVGGNFLPHAGVAVIAENTWAALQGRRKLKVEWDLTSEAAAANAKYDSDAFRQELQATTSRPGKPVRRKGDVDAALGAGKSVKADYHVPHLAQTPMEPPAAVAIFNNGKWEIWSPTQGPELAQHYIGLAMLEPDPVKGLIWLATELSELKDCERPAQQVFNESMAKMLGVDEPTLFKLRDELKKRVRDNVTVHVTLLGGGFGRKSNPDYAIEAAFLARNHPGVPIRVQWTREDDIKFSFYNAVSHQHFEAALAGDGTARALLQRSAFSSFFATVFPPPSPSLPPAVNDICAKARAAFHNGGEYPYGSAIERAQGLEDNPYAIDNLRIENSPAPNHVRCGWMRSVANIYHAFGLGSFVDEMAIAAGVDAKTYMLRLIGQGRMFDEEFFKAQQVECFDNNLFPVNQKMMSIGGNQREILPGYPPDTRRLRAVIERVAEMSKWDARQGKLGMNRGLGIAAHRSFLSYVALVFDVSLNSANELTIHEAFAAYDCGFVVNPDRVNAQIEGGILYGLSLALLGEITLKNGAVVENNFDDYPVLRIHQAPKSIRMQFVKPSDEVVNSYPAEKDDVRGIGVPATGVGEPPTAAVAPALANAIVAAGGPRIREIPFRKHVVVL